MILKKKRTRVTTLLDSSQLNSQNNVAVVDDHNAPMLQFNNPGAHQARGSPDPGAIRPGGH